ncbi:Hypothetical predicted protein [Octopus vulgaris]|uniref:Uncharacterized protein n=1 Tax=Octopus vulgaris TaxID=6645 RepID=A0AA36F3I9_OCTVU|nr:Hypothetical predicted protein [Octopus vulgaris]
MKKMEKVICLKYLTAVIYIALLPKVNSQNGGNTNVIRPDVTESITYYLDKSQDCNGNIQEVSNQVIITAPGGANGNSVPSSCTITLRSATLKPTIFQLNIQTVVLECSMNFYIFDGTEEQTTLKSYSCHTKLTVPIQLVTTGNTVSFRLIRPSTGSARYDIRIIAQTINDPTSGGGGGIDHGVLDPDKSYLRKFSTDTIIILISVAYLVAILICIIILIVRCVRSSREEKKYSERPLAYNNYGLTPATSVNSSVMSVYATKPSSDIKSIGRNKSFRSRMANSTEDTDSVFEAMQSNMKAQLNAPSSYSSSYNNPSYQRTPPTKRMSGRRTAFQNEASAAVRTSRGHRRNHETAVKEVNKPVESVKSSVSQQIQTDLYDDDDGGEVTSEVELASTGMNTDPEMTDHGIQCEVETSDDIINSDEVNAISKQAFEYLKQHKHLQSPSLSHPHGTVSDDEMGQKYEHNRYYYPAQQGLHGSPAMHRFAHPMEQYGSPEPHTLHFDPALRQTNITPPSYMLRANGYGPQRGPKPPVLTDLEDRYIPVYSYLVNRGYKIPESDKNASGSSATGTSHHSDLRMVQTDDSDFSANLDSGVELMKR